MNYGHHPAYSSSSRRDMRMENHGGIISTTTELSDNPTSKAIEYQIGTYLTKEMTNLTFGVGLYLLIRVG
jgi:hypothetical protein